MHYNAGYGFKPSRSGHIFVIAKLSENGILRQYLNTHCSDHAFKLCEFKDQLPTHAWDFIWSDNGAFKQSGYWDSSEVEYKKIIKGTITEAPFLWLNIKEAIKASVKQFGLADVGDGLTPQIYNSNPYWKIQQYYNQQMLQYMSSKQNTGMLNCSKINVLYMVVYLSTLLTFLLALIFQKLSQASIRLLILCLAFCFINAAITASLANILARLNSRCIWLLPVLLFTLLLKDFLARKRLSQNKFERSVL